MPETFCTIRPYCLTCGPERRDLAIAGLIFGACTFLLGLLIGWGACAWHAARGPLIGAGLLVLAGCGASPTAPIPSAARQCWLVPVPAVTRDVVICTPQLCRVVTIEVTPATTQEVCR